MSQNKQSRKHLIGRSYKNDEFDWPFNFVIATSMNNLKLHKNRGLEIPGNISPLQGNFPRILTSFKNFALSSQFCFIKIPKISRIHSSHAMTCNMEGEIPKGARYT